MTGGLRKALARAVLPLLLIDPPARRRSEGAVGPHFHKVLVLAVHSGVVQRFLAGNYLGIALRLVGQIAIPLERFVTDRRACWEGGVS